MKQLCDTYAVSAPTMRRALKALIDAGILQRSRRTLRCVPAVSPRALSSIVLIAAGLASGQVAISAPWALEQYHALEHECASAGLTLRILAFDVASGRLYDQSGSSVARLESCCARYAALGLMVWTVAIPSEALAALSAETARTGLPAAFLDESNALASSGISLARRARVFAQRVDERAGALLGRYLLGKGHRRLAYISPYRFDWAVRRLEGLREALAGVPGARVEECIDTTDVYRTQSVEVLREEAQRRLSSMTGAAAPHPFGALSHLRRYYLGEIADAILIADIIRPLCERALERGEISAWVCSCDMAGLCAADFLAGRGLHPPRPVALAGFDDALESSIGRLTSCNFNYPALMRSMIGHVVSPREARGSGGNGGGMVEPYVAERSSTA